MNSKESKTFGPSDRSFSRITRQITYIKTSLSKVLQDSVSVNLTAEIPLLLQKMRIENNEDCGTLSHILQEGAPL